MHTYIHIYTHTHIHIYVYNGWGRDLAPLHPCAPVAPTTTSRDPGAQVGYALAPRWEASRENRHDDVLLRDWHSVPPLGSFIGLGAPSKGS
jgi:hypothetical protein